MKTLKFKDFKAKWILSGIKTSSMRLFDEKNIQKDDDLELINSDTQEKFANARVVEVVEKKIKDLCDNDFDGHEKFESNKQMFEIYKKYYGDRVDENTIVKIIKFKLIK